MFGINHNTNTGDFNSSTIKKEALLNHSWLLFETQYITYVWSTKYSTPSKSHPKVENDWIGIFVQMIHNKEAITGTLLTGL